MESPPLYLKVQYKEIIKKVKVNVEIVTIPLLIAPFHKYLDGAEHGHPPLLYSRNHQNQLERIEDDSQLRAVIALARPPQLARIFIKESPLSEYRPSRKNSQPQSQEI